MKKQTGAGGRKAIVAIAIVLAVVFAGFAGLADRMNRRRQAPTNTTAARGVTLTLTGSRREPGCTGTPDLGYTARPATVPQS